MAKIKNDKYYTPMWLVEYTVNKAKDIIGEENIAQFLEPSAGDGRFLDYLPSNTLAYDLYPDNNKIKQQDFLDLEIEYMKGRCIITNPPYGEKGNLYQKFANKSFQIGDYVVFILPITQLDNNYYIYKFDIIYSEDLGVINFGNDKKIHVALNIYKRPLDNRLNKRKDIYTDNEIMTMRVLMTNRETQKHVDNFGRYDLAVVGWGANVGKICEPFQQTNTIIIRINDIKNYDYIYNKINNLDWFKLTNSKGNNSLSIWHIYKYVLTEMHKDGLYNKDRKFLKQYNI